jgi:hypothetical protein
VKNPWDSILILAVGRKQRIDTSLILFLAGGMGIGAPARRVACMPRRLVDTLLSQRLNRSLDTEQYCIGLAITN